MLISHGQLPALALWSHLQKWNLRYTNDTNSKVSLCQRDMTKLNIDVIVNSVNKTIIDGGCIDGAIHKAAGSGLVGKCQNLNGWETGESKITLATNCQLIICFIL